MQKLATLLILLLSCGNLSAQFQDWVSYQSRMNNYPESVYFTGFMSKYFDKNDDLEEVKLELLEQAKVQLSENIQITIKSNIVNKMTNINSVSLEEFEKVSQSYSSVNLSRLKTDFYIKSQGKEAMAFAWVKKSEVAAHYTRLIQEHYQKIKSFYLLGTELQRISPSETLKTLYATQVLFRKIEEAQAILITCGVDDPQVIMKTPVFDLKRKITQITEVIKNSKNLSIENLSAFLVATLKMQKESLNQPIQVSNFTYRDSGAGSEFSDRLTTLLRNDLTREGFQVRAFGNTPSESKKGYVLSGNYWEDGVDEIQVVVSLNKKDINQTELQVAGGEAWTSISQLVKANVAYKPANYFEAVEKGQLLASKEIINGGAKLELWTSKGDKGLIFREGEPLRVSVRMNKIGYIRIVNYMADGTQVLLVDNYHIDYRKVNRMIQLPYEWEVSCPCGIEFIQANSQDVEFVPLTTTNEDGFQVITNSAAEIIESSRAYREEAAKSGGFAVEERLILSTID